MRKVYHIPKPTLSYGGSKQSTAKGTTSGLTGNKTKWFNHLSSQTQVGKDHPLLFNRTMVDEVLAQLWR
jgi:hypothetical protein